MSREGLGNSYKEPESEAEKKLAEIWTQVLGVKQVGVRDNFFSLGGDSIRSIQLKSQAEQQGLSFTLEQLFRLQTIEALATEMEGGIQKEEKKKAEIIPRFGLIREEDRAKISEGMEDAYPLTRLQAGMLFHSEYSPETGIYHDLFSYHLKARLDERVLEQALEAMLKRHPVLRTSIDLSSYSEPLQLVHRSVALPLEVSELWGESETAREEEFRVWF